MKRDIGLVLPGGTTLGAVQVPGIETWAPRAAWTVGGSVGGANSTFVGMGRHEELRPIWLDVGETGTRWFQRLNPAFWNGLFSLAPLRAKLAAYKVGVDGYRIPTYVGMTHMATKRYFSIALNDLKLADQLDAIVVTCQQPAVHRPERFQGRYYADAGVRNVIPSIPNGATPVDEVVVVCCSPIEEAHRFAVVNEDDVSTAFGQAQAAVQAFMGNTVLSDVQERIAEARALGARRISFFAPKTWADVGKPFVATPATIALRLRTGADMIQEPRLVVDL